MKKTEDSSSFEQWLVLATFIAGVLRKILSGAQVQHHLQNKRALEKQLCEFFQSPIDIYTDIRNEWEDFYKKTMNLTNVDFSMVRIPEMPNDSKKWRLLFIAAGITQNQIYDSWTFPKWKAYDDLDKEILYHKRNTNEAYAIWVLDSPEPDTETLGKSTRQADPGSVKDDFKDLGGATGITNLEMMVFNGKYFDETGKVLDVKGLTFCSASRDSDGNIPYVYRDDDGKVGVYYLSLGNSISGYGVRRVVSCS